MKRFYKETGAMPEAGGFVVTLDGRVVKTPGRRALMLPAEALAAAIAAEWAAQGEQIEPETMPLMRLAATALDQVGPQRAAIIDAVAAYGGSDLVCYRVRHPEELARRQNASWAPLVDWAAATYEAPLEVTDGLMHAAQPEASLRRLRAVVEAGDDFRLSGLQNAVGALGSLVIGLALMEGRLTPEQAFAAAELDALYQIEQWGEDGEAMARHRALLEDIVATRRYFDALTV
jgi:chaperone required for assembly of F1-ATPase